jgi:DNA replication protein DnaC
LENFDFDFNSKINRAQIQEAATCRFIEQHEPILIVGPCGTGKSHIAQAIAHCVIRRGIDVLWMPQSKLFSELQTARALGRYEKKMAELVKVPLLISGRVDQSPSQPPI